MAAVGLKEVNIYVLLRHNTIAQNIANHPILNFSGGRAAAGSMGGTAVVGEGVSISVGIKGGGKVNGGGIIYGEVVICRGEEGRGTNG